MRVYKMYPSSINDRYLDEVVERLRKGEVIIYPTDTLFAVGCSALNNRAVERVCRIKGINPAKQHLSMVCAGISQASEYAQINNEAFRILKENLPGPFTFILPASPKLAKAFKGRHQVGVRVPANAIAQMLAERLGNPILSSSVEWDGADDEALTMPEEIETHYENEVDAIIETGESMPFVSAIIDLTDSSNPEIIREGIIEPQL